MRHHPKHHGFKCGCPPHPANQIVHPTKHNVVHKCIEHDVQHVHPSHTTIMNHHLTKNHHVYPHSTSVVNTYDSVNVPGGPMPSQVSPANFGPGQPGGGPTAPGMPNNQVAGVQSPYNQPMMSPGFESPDGLKPWKKPNKWC